MRERFKLDIPGLASKLADTKTAMADKPKAKPTPKTQAKQGLPFGKRNYIWFGIALVTIIVGYIFLGSGDITVAPILLVLGYCVLVPVAILLPPEKKAKAVAAGQVSQPPAGSI